MWLPGAFPRFLSCALNAFCEEAKYLSYNHKNKLWSAAFTQHGHFYIKYTICFSSTHLCGMSLVAISSQTSWEMLVNSLGDSTVTVFCFLSFCNYNRLSLYYTIILNLFLYYTHIFKSYWNILILVINVLSTMYSTTSFSANTLNIYAIASTW